MRNRAAIAASINSLPRITPWRWCLAGTGIFFFGLGGVGAMVPGMPTTVFLLLGSYCLTKSCPWLEERLLNTRLLRPYAEFIRSKEPMSLRARLIAMGMMWTSIAVSMTAMAAAGRLDAKLGAIMFGLGLIGTLSIAMFRRARCGAGDGAAAAEQGSTQN